MLRLAAKVWFFSAWDRLGVLFLLNSLLIGCFSLGFAIPTLFPVTAAAGVILVSASLALSPLLVSGRRLSLADWLVKTLRLLPLTVFWVAGWSVSIFLLLQTGVLFLFGSVWILFWTLYQGWFAATAQMEAGPLESLRQGWLLVWDNPRTGAAMLAGTVALTVLSVAGLGFFPGFAGMSHWWGVVLRLRRLGYAWQRENPEWNGSLPWSRILAAEAAIYEGRTLKNLLFPWRD